MLSVVNPSLIGLIVTDVDFSVLEGQAEESCFQC